MEQELQLMQLGFYVDSEAPGITSPYRYYRSSKLPNPKKLGTALDRNKDTIFDE
jgi:hypothetical protein